MERTGPSFYLNDLSFLRSGREAPPFRPVGKEAKDGSGSITPETRSGREESAQTERRDMVARDAGATVRWQEVRGGPESDLVVIIQATP